MVPSMIRNSRSGRASNAVSRTTRRSLCRATYVVTASLVRARHLPALILRLASCEICDSVRICFQPLSSRVEETTKMFDETKEYP